MHKLEPIENGILEESSISSYLYTDVEIDSEKYIQLQGHSYKVIAMFDNSFSLASKCKYRYLLDKMNNAVDFILRDK